MSAAARKAASERMKKYWAERRKTAKKRVRNTGRKMAVRKSAAKTAAA